MIVDFNKQFQQINQYTFYYKYTIFSILNGFLGISIRKINQYLKLIYQRQSLRVIKFQMQIEAPAYKDIEQELGSSSNIRFYIQEQSLQYFNEDQTDSKKQPSLLPLPFNRVISEIITDILIMNKEISSNSNISISLIQNGREITKTKKLYWDKFVRDQINFKFVADAYSCLSYPKKELLKNNVLALSNLLLKLGINMSKVSIILLQKQISYNCLSLFGLSVAFLQYLQYELFKSKQIKEEIQSSLFLRQLPRITVIKLARKRNIYETYLLQTSQKVFFTDNSKAPVKNLQFIELYEKQDDLWKDFKRQTSYEHFISHNLKQKLGIQAPFSFQLYYFLQQLIFPQIKAFRPDMILFIQSYQDDQLIMDPQVRGIILSETIESLTPKIYFLRQMGITSFLYDDLVEKYPGWQNSYQPSILQKIQKQELRIFLQMKNPSLATPQTLKYLKDSRKLYMDDIANSALALIQKNSFIRLKQKAHQHIYSQDFLQKMNLMYQQKLTELENIPNKNDHYEEMEQTLIRNQSLSQKTQQFLNANYNYQASSFDNIVKLINQHKFYNEIFNLKTNKIQKLITSREEEKSYTFCDQDQIYVKYFQQILVIFILKSSEYIILYKKYENQVFTLGERAAWDNDNQRLVSCTLTCSDRYIYRAFGKFINRPRQYNNVIYRHLILPQRNGTYGKWQKFSDQCVPLSSNGQKGQPIELQNKYAGYGYYDKKYQHNIMMGGYVDCANQQKISKRIYLIEDDRKPVYAMGKTSKMIFEQKNKPTLYPFVFGLPFTTDKQVLVLNTNGYIDQLNNNQKLFLTLLNKSKNPIENGVRWQSKLNIQAKQTLKTLNQMSDTEIDHKEQYLNYKDRIVDYIVLAGDKINRYEGRCSLRTLSQGPLVLQIKEKTLYAKSFSKKEPQQFQIQFQ